MHFPMSAESFRILKIFSLDILKPNITWRERIFFNATMHGSDVYVKGILSLDSILD